jgi:hypothetical protein
MPAHCSKINPEYPSLGKFVGDTAPAKDARAEELRAAYQRIAELESALGECRDYFDDRADADCDQDGFIPNEEMRMMTAIDEVLS